MNPICTHNLEAPSLYRRLASWTYEGILLFGVTFVAAYLFSALSQSRHALMHRSALMAFLFVIYGIYFTWFWYKGQTLAMKTWHIELVDHHGQRLTQKRALLRYCLAWVWFLPPLLLALGLQLTLAATGWAMLAWVSVWALLSRFQRHGQFWHDAWAKSYIVSCHPNNQ